MGQRNTIATLEIGLEMPTGAAIADLNRFGGAVDTISAQAIRDLDKIDAAMHNVGGLDAATASAVRLADETARTALQMAREADRAERAGERMVAQLDRQIQTYGLTRSEVRALRAEEAARDADRVKAGDLANEIRAKEAQLAAMEAASAQAKQQAASAAAAAMKAEANAVEAAAREHKQLADAVQASHAAQLADAAAAERLRMATDDVYAATKRVNAEIAESTRLYHAGATAPAEYARQQEVLSARLRAVGQTTDSAMGAIKRGGGTMTQLSFQLNDVATMAAMGAKPMQIFASQAGQIFQVAQMAEGGVKGFAGEIASLTMRFAPLLAVAAVAGVAIYQWKQAIDDQANMKAYVQTLGLTQKEMKKLGDQSVTMGDMLKGFWKAVNEGDGKGESLMSKLFTDQDKQTLQSLLDFTINVFKGIAAASYGLVVGSYRAGVAIWQQFPAALGDIFVQAVNGSVTAIEYLVNKGIDAVNAIARAGNAIVGKDLFGQFEQVQLAKMENSYSGAAAKLGKGIGDAFDGAVKEALGGMDRIGDLTGKYATQSAQERARAKANEIIGDRTPKSKTDKHAEQLEREAAATEAQIRNLLALADAYRTSGAEALIAEARVKAESKAIKQRADIEEAVAREVRLAIAQRVSDAAKGAAQMRDEATIRRQINGEVAAGLVPSERANDLVRERIAELPLLTAIEAANKLGLTGMAAEATKALNDQRAAQKALTAEEDAARANERAQAASDQLAQIELEGTLIGATNLVRVRAIALLHAEQEARRSGAGPEWVQQQADAAVATERNAIALDRFNNLLPDSEAAVRQYAGAFADAFGSMGEAIGRATIALVDHGAEQRRIARAVAAGQMTVTRAANESANAQIDLYAGVTGAAKSMFSERSSIYKGLQAAEAVLRAFQLATSIQRMIQDTTETATTVANAGVRAAAAGTEGIANQSKLPFPANLAAMAATAAALVGVGVAVLGGIGGGGGKNPLPEANEGRGTVLGDTKAQSESIRRGIDALKEVDVLMLTSSREMLSHLRSIDNQIGGVAAQIVRGGDVDATAGITEGFKTNVIGSVLKAVVPIFGGALASLFGSKTEIVGSGLYGRGQTVGDILATGYDAQTYADTKKTSKFLGITTGTKYGTQYGAADAGLENQFTLILRGFASAIGDAAGPLGEATDTVKARLNSFVVDIGKVDLKGLTGEQITERLSAIFGAAADGMAAAAFPGIQRFQKAGEGMFETLVRISSTVEAVTSSFEMLGRSGIGVDASVALADLFDNVSDLTSAQKSYFDAYYTAAEQAAARTAQMERAIGSLGLAMPKTLAGFRQLVDAQDLTTDAGRSVYATLIQLAPAFADLQSAMGGAKSAADIMAERQDLERKLLELNGDTAAIRALDLAKLDASNRGLQEQVWAAEAAKEAADKAAELRKAWSSVGDTIEEEIRRIRGLDDAQGPAGFAGLMGQFNAITAAARGGDMDAAKQLPALSRSLLDAAAQAATSRQELERVRAQTAASLEDTYATVQGFGGADSAADVATRSAEAMAQAATSAATTASSTSDMATQLRLLTEQVAGMRSENLAGHAATAGNTARTAKVLENVSAPTGGSALQTEAA